MNCQEYTALDRFRKSFLAVLVYFGQRVREYGPIAIVGVVTTTCVNETDGDCTFDVQTADGPFHCEITPCAPESLRDAARALIAGDRVRVSGTKRWDPPHIGGINHFRGHWEVHPVESVTKEA